MGDAEDQARLAQMTEKEREQEIFKRIEQREIMKTRFEIEKKLRMARKQEMKKQKESRKKEKSAEERKVDRAPDPKERSKDRKKTIEEKQDKKFHAMSLLKARREEKKERGKVSKKLYSHTFIYGLSIFINTLYPFYQRRKRNRG